MRASPRSELRAAPLGPARTMRLFDLDADLGSALDFEQLSPACQEVVVPVISLGVGSWVPGAHPHDAVALVLTEGALLREQRLDDLPDVQLTGPGDYLDPRLLADPETQWRVLAAAEIAVLDARVDDVARAFPQLSVAVIARVFDAQREQQAIAAIRSLPRVGDRIEALFSRAARRWGRVTPHGLTVELAISHEDLGHLVGSRRPTVSLALKELRAQGRLERLDPANWLLPQGRVSAADH